MASKVISFRFSDAEVEALQALQTSEDDSINQTAARLLRGLLSTSTAVSSTELSTQTGNLSTDVDIQELVKREVEQAVAKSMNEIKREVDERLGELSA